ncbi:MAG: Gfo/Idh/MocA family protein [Solirubrobacteraceae bacterium]
MSAGEQVRIALVGAGRMGQAHLRVLEASSFIRPAGVVEPVAATRDALAARGVPVHSTVEDLLAADAVDAVLIAAPSDQHARLVSSCVVARVPVLCEKPLGVQVDDARAAKRAADDAGTFLQVGYWRRFVPELRELRERIAGGELGEVLHIACMQWDAEPPSAQFRAHSGGIAVDMGVHEFDQARWLLAQEIDWVAAAPAGPTGSSTSASDPDAATILAQLSGGATATISLGRQFPHADSCWIEVFGSRGYGRLPFMWDADGHQVLLDAMVAQAESFARAVRGGPREGASADDAIAALLAAELVTDALAQPSERGSRPPTPSN